MEKETRRARNRQIERKKKAKKRTATLIFSLIALLIAAGIGYLVWDSIDRRTVITYQGARVPTSDFRFLHMMAGAEEGDEFAREAAFNGFLRTLAVLDHARRAGITVPDEDMEPLRETAADNREWIVSWQGAGNMRGTSVERIAQFLSVGTMSGWQVHPGPLTELLMEHELPDFEVPQDELDEHLEELDEDITAAATEQMVQFIVTDDWDTAWNAHTLAYEEGVPFDELIERYHSPGEDDEFENPATLLDFAMGFNAGEHWQEIMELEVGEISDVLSLEDGFAVVRMYSSEVNEETLEEITENVIEAFIAERKLEAFLEILDGWVAEADYTRNERALRHF